jgi:hypothetical protein
MVSKNLLRRTPVLAGRSVPEESTEHVEKKTHESLWLNTLIEPLPSALE